MHKNILTQFEVLFFFLPPSRSVVRLVIWGRKCTQKRVCYVTDGITRSAVYTPQCPLVSLTMSYFDEAFGVSWLSDLRVGYFDCSYLRAYGYMSRRNEPACLLDDSPKTNLRHHYREEGFKLFYTPTSKSDEISCLFCPRAHPATRTT